MKIGSINLDNNVVMAPLAGITSLPFRLLAKEAGAGLVCSEMISSNGLVFQSSKTRKMLDTVKEEYPLSVQIFGSDPNIMADAAVMAEDAGAAILDINFGCSVKKVLKTGAGAALMKSPGQTERILKAVRHAVKIPVTIKIRTGWNATGDQALAISKVAQDCGIDAIAVHPRTAAQAFGGKADWSVIRMVKESIAIPVIGNGDIETADDAARMITETGCDGLMIGRAAIGNPLMLGGIVAKLKGETIPEINLHQRFDVMMRYLEESVKYIGEAHACRMMRSRLSWFVKGLPNNKQFRESIKTVKTEEEARNIIKEYMASILPS